MLQRSRGEGPDWGPEGGVWQEPAAEHHRDNVNHISHSLTSPLKPKRVPSNPQAAQAMHTEGMGDRGAGDRDDRQREQNSRDSHPRTSHFQPLICLGQSALSRGGQVLAPSSDQGTGQNVDPCTELWC